MKNKIALLLFTLSFSVFSQSKGFVGLQTGVYTFTTTYQNAMGQRLMDYDFAFNAGYGLIGGYSIDDVHTIRGMFGITPGGSRRVGGGLLYDNRIEYTSFNAEYIHTPDWFTGNTKIYFGGGFGVYSARQLNTTYFIQGKQVDFFNYMEYNSPNPHRDFFVDQVEKNSGVIPDGDFFKRYDVRFSSLIGIKTQINERFALNLEMVSMLSLMDVNAKEWRLERRNGDYKRSRNLIGGIQLGFTAQI